MSSPTVIHDRQLQPRDVRRLPLATFTGVLSRADQFKSSACSSACRAFYHWILATSRCGTSVCSTALNLATAERWQSQPIRSSCEAHCQQACSYVGQGTVHHPSDTQMTIRLASADEASSVRGLAQGPHQTLATKHKCQKKFVTAWLLL